MCLILPARVVSVGDGCADIELPDGVRASVDTSLADGVAPGQYVLFDRGVVLKTIEATEAEAILAMYAELGELMDA
jgi:hydrogenase assembly chaperone HypC/HupF